MQGRANGGRQSKLKKRKVSSASQILTSNSTSINNEPMHVQIIENKHESTANVNTTEENSDKHHFSHIALKKPVVINSNLIQSIIGSSSSNNRKSITSREQERWSSHILDNRGAKLRYLNILGETSVSFTNDQIKHPSQQGRNSLLKGHGIRIPSSSLSYKLSSIYDDHINPKPAENLSYLGKLRIVHENGASVRDDFRIDGSNKICHLAKYEIRKYLTKQWLNPDVNDDECKGVYRYKIILDDKDNYKTNKRNTYGWISDRSRLKDDPYIILEPIETKTHSER